MGALAKHASIKGSYIFSTRDITEIYSALRLPPLGSTKSKAGQVRLQRDEMDVKMDVTRIIDVMQSECYLLVKGPKLYQLQAM